MSADFIAALQSKLTQLRSDQFSRFAPPEDFGGRESAVLVLFAGDATAEIELLLIERALDGGVHSGQIAFPGGGLDAADADHTAAALREAAEEVGLQTDSVEVIGQLPRLWLPASDNAVVPVVAWWQRPHEITRLDEREVAAAARVPLRLLADPANRVHVLHPSGFRGPGFEVNDWLVWGFTGGIIDGLLKLLDLDSDWAGRERAL